MVKISQKKQVTNCPKTGNHLDTSAKKALMHPPAPKNSHGKIPEPHFNPRKPSEKNSPSVLEPEKQRDAPSRKRKPPLPASSGGRIYPKPLFNQVHRQLRAQAQFVIGVMSESLKRGQGSFRTDFPKNAGGGTFQNKIVRLIQRTDDISFSRWAGCLAFVLHFWGSFFHSSRSNAKLLFSEPCSKNLIRDAGISQSAFFSSVAT